jgi:hypothetical protein
MSEQDELAFAEPSHYAIYTLQILRVENDSNLRTYYVPTNAIDKMEAPYYIRYMYLSSTA